MAGQRLSLRHTGLIAGAALIGLGIFILYQNLAGIVVQWKYVLAANGSEDLGEPLAVILAFAQAYASHHHRFLQYLFQRMLVSFWPLLLVILGMDALMDGCECIPKKDCGLVELSTGRSTLK